MQAQSQDGSDRGKNKAQVGANSEEIKGPYYSCNGFSDCYYYDSSGSED